MGAVDEAPAEAVRCDACGREFAPDEPRLVSCCRGSRHSTAQPPTTADAPRSPRTLDAFATVGRGRVTLLLRDAALLSPILDYAVRKLRSDAQRLSVAQRVLIARIMNAEADYLHLARLCTVAEAAQTLGVKERRVRALLERGQLRGQKVEGRWLIERASVFKRLDPPPPIEPDVTTTAPTRALLIGGKREPGQMEPADNRRERQSWTDPTGDEGAYRADRGIEAAREYDQTEDVNL